MSSLRLTALTLPKLLNHASTLKPIGNLAATDTNLTYLDIDDNFIHQLFPLLEIAEDSNFRTLEKPQYFTGNFIGAHISVIYPEENKWAHHQELGKEHTFKIKNIYSTILERKKYYILLIESHSLNELRRQHHLPSLLLFKNHWIDFHITIGVQHAA